MTQLPPHFRWGTTSSSVQLEGVAPAADWSAWEATGRAPASGEGSGFAIDFRTDLELLALLGLKAIRLTLEWARIEPVPDKVDRAAIDFYSDVLRHAQDLGMEPWVTLVHTSLPGWFSEDTSGFRDAEARSYWWMRQVDRCAEHFAPLVAGWTPIDDPIGWAVRAHLLGNRPPARPDGLLLREAIEGVLEADHAAAQHLAAGGGTTMAVRGVPTIFGHGHGADVTSDFWASLVFDSWINVLDSGELVLPDRRPVIRPSWVDDFDYIGLSFDHPIALDAEGALHSFPRGAKTMDNGFAPLPEELAVVVHRVAERLPNRKLMISGNGVVTTDDEWREELLRETVERVKQLVDDGIDLHGYFHDTGIDGYEWRAGFATARGLIDRDRNVKASGTYLASIASEQRA